MYFFWSSYKTESEKSLPDLSMALVSVKNIHFERDPRWQWRQNHRPRGLLTQRPCREAGDMPD
jgi:hypothetical protein